MSEAEEVYFVEAIASSGSTLLMYCYMAGGKPMDREQAEKHLHHLLDIKKMPGFIGAEGAELRLVCFRRGEILKSAPLGAPEAAEGFAA